MAIGLLCLMELNQLWPTVELAEVGSIREAAGELSLSPRVVFSQIRNLEPKISTTSHERVSNRLQLTVAGRKLVERARKLLATQDEASVDLR